MNYFNSDITFREDGTICILLKMDIDIDCLITYLNSYCDWDLTLLKNVLYHEKNKLLEDTKFNIKVIGGELFIEQFSMTRYYSLIKCSEHTTNTVMLDNNNIGYKFYDGSCFYDSMIINLEEKARLYSSICRLICDVKRHFDNNSTIIDANMLIDYCGLFNERNRKIVHGGEKVSLSLPTFYEEKFDWMSLDIVDSKSFEVVGHIEIKLKKKGEDNFSYIGNVSYHIKDIFKHMGYATEALKELGNYVRECADEYNKVLYVSTMENNYYSQKVALANNAKLYYEGEVPSSEILSKIGKVKRVKIYIIDNL